MRKAYVVPLLVLALGLCFTALPNPTSAQVAVGISVRIGPPALPVYVQPICPGPDYIWIPGYWAWGPDGYYWVPGTWVLAPQPGLYWTPGWWGYDADGDDYLWHPGYWGPHVGFYGGINYGFGYFGAGYVGGEWRDRHFYYNRAVTNVNVTVVRNVYVNRTVVRNVHEDRVSYNGGPHGINARPSADQQRWERERHFGPTRMQEQHVNQARNNRALHYSDNHGRPPIAATQRATQFSGPGVVRPGNNRNQNQFHPPANQNRPRGNYEQQPNNRQNNRNYQPPRNQPNNQRPENRNYNPPRNQPNRPEQQPRYNPPRNQPRPEAQPRNEQPRGNPGGERGGRGNQNRDNGGRDGGGRDGGR